MSNGEWRGLAAGGGARRFHEVILACGFTRRLAGKRVEPCFEYVQRYGTHAKAVLPQLREIRTQLVAAAGRNPKSEQVEKLDKCIAAIEPSTATPTVVSVEEFKARTPTPPTQP